MGITSEQITAFGVDQNRDNINSILENAKAEIGSLVNMWYSN